MLPSDRNDEARSPICCKNRPAPYRRGCRSHRPAYGVHGDSSSSLGGPRSSLVAQPGGLTMRSEPTQNAALAAAPTGRSPRGSTAQRQGGRWRERGCRPSARGRPPPYYVRFRSHRGSHDTLLVTDGGRSCSVKSGTLAEFSCCGCGSITIGAEPSC
eukprot:scaffold174308_cov32-Tisochrysis_lutea.AAC.4